MPVTLKGQTIKKDGAAKMQSKATPVTNIPIIKNALNSVFYCYVLVGQSYFLAQQYANIVLIIKYL